MARRALGVSGSFSFPALTPIGSTRFHSSSCSTHWAKSSSSVFKRLRGHGQDHRAQHREALRDVRMALLEADVHFQVVRSFTERDARAGARPGGARQPHPRAALHQDRPRRAGRARWAAQAGSARPRRRRRRWRSCWSGLQGSGKTTTAAKLARYLKIERGRAARTWSRPTSTVRPPSSSSTTLGAAGRLPVHPSHARAPNPVRSAASARRRPPRTAGHDIVHHRHRRPPAHRRRADGRARARSRRRSTPHHIVPGRRRDDRSGRGERRPGLPRPARHQRRHPHQARRRRARRRGAVDPRRSPARRSCSSAPARSSTRSRSSTPTAWRRASSAWATC